MNNRKFAFIICTNNETLIHECLTYISLLYIPDGYTVDTLTITDAPSITSGYNEGMNSSDAKYKIYMHQDVFILNKYLLYDIIDIFNADSNIGMIGIVGYQNVSSTGMMWQEKRYGLTKLYGSYRKYPNSLYTNNEYISYRYDLAKDGFTEVTIVDGLMMITSQDLSWDEFTLKDWDFYDAFQCINFLENSYKIVVPNQIFPWVIHDDGYILSMWNYNKYRKAFINRFNKYLGLNAPQIRELSSKIADC